MNLIEQLGGYEKANGYLHELYKIPMHEQTEDTITWLPLLLLQYRREHNIFEVGDKVFYTGRANDNDLYILKEIYNGHDFVVGSNGADRDFWTLFVSEIRHATDEEIQAWRRL